MKATLIIALLVSVQYVSSKPDIIAMRNQKTSNIQGQKLDLNKRSLLHRAGRDVFSNCNDCLEWYEGWDYSTIHNNCYEGLWAPCSKANMKSNLLTLLIVCSVRKIMS